MLGRRRAGSSAKVASSRSTAPGSRSDAEIVRIDDPKGIGPRRPAYATSSDYTERSVAVGITYDPCPESALGLSARVSPGWGGNAQGGAEALWSQETMAYGPLAGMSHDPLMNGGGQRLDTEGGYCPSQGVSQRRGHLPRRTPTGANRVPTRPDEQDPRGHALGSLCLSVTVPAEKRAQRRWQQERQPSGCTRSTSTNCGNRCCRRDTRQWTGGR